MFEGFVLSEELVFLFIVCKESLLVLRHRDAQLTILIGTRPTRDDNLSDVINVLFIGVLVNKGAALSKSFAFRYLLFPDLVTELVVQVFHHDQKGVNGFQVFSNDAVSLLFFYFFI